MVLLVRKHSGMQLSVNHITSHPYLTFLNSIVETLLNELSRIGPGNLTIASLTAGIDSYGLGKLYESGKVKRMIGSYVGENKVCSYLPCITIITLRLSFLLEVMLSPEF